MKKSVLCSYLLHLLWPRPQLSGSPVANWCVGWLLGCLCCLSLFLMFLCTVSPLVAQVLHSWFSAQLVAAGCLCTVSPFLLLLAAPHYRPQPVKTSDCGRSSFKCKQQFCISRSGCPVILFLVLPAIQLWIL